MDVCGIKADFTHHLFTETERKKLFQLCDTANLRNNQHAMFHGENINHTEQRPALHTALRDSSSNTLMVNGIDVKQQVCDARAHIQSICEWADAQSFKHIVHLGAGGSFWGPLCVTQALSPLSRKMDVTFVAGLDPVEFEEAIQHFDPSQTLIIVASKSFKTEESLLNAQRAKAWLTQAGIADPLSHFVAITENTIEAETFGIDASRILPIWPWVGGRFSVWSAVGLPIILAYGQQAFDELLAGARTMDEHFLEADWQYNMPVTMALLEYGYRQFYDYNTHAIIPYVFGLRALVPHLQQLHMESLGKPSTMPTGTIVWGALGSHAQHTFNQLLHQGSECVPIDFILSEADCEKTPQIRKHCLAQQKALMSGDEGERIEARLPGNRPSTVLTLDSLNPQTLGALLALYEHKVVSLAWLYDINPFDQFGVEYSKRMAR